MKKQSPLRTLAFIIFCLVVLGAYVANADDREATTRDAATFRTAPPPPHRSTPAICITIELDNKKHAHILDHAWDAIRVNRPAFSISPLDHAREVKRLHIARDEADANRRASLKGIPTMPGFDRDEYPPAISDEGGKGADVRYVRSSENRSAGAEMGQQLRGYPDGQCFRYEPPPQR